MAVEVRIPNARQEDAMAALRTLLNFIGEDADREGLRETPSRILKSWAELFAGYRQDPEKILSTTFAEVQGYQELVLLRDIPFQSFCEHHWLPFSGTAHVAYLPGQRVVGLSKLARLVDCFARRLQIQERMTQQIAESLKNHLAARGTAVLVQAHHGCMSCRGVRKEGTTMVTSAFTGDLGRTELRAEFLTLIRS